MTPELLVYVIDSVLSLVSRGGLVLGEALPIGQDDAARANELVSRGVLKLCSPPCFGIELCCLSKINSV